MLSFGEKFLAVIACFLMFCGVLWIASEYEKDEVKTTANSEPQVIAMYEEYRNFSTFTIAGAQDNKVVIPVNTAYARQWNRPGVVIAERSNLLMLAGISERQLLVANNPPEYSPSSVYKKVMRLPDGRFQDEIISVDVFNQLKQTHNVRKPVELNGGQGWNVSGFNHLDKLSKSNPVTYTIYLDKIGLFGVDGIEVKTEMPFWYTVDASLSSATTSSRPCDVPHCHNTAVVLKLGK